MNDKFRQPVETVNLPFDMDSILNRFDTGGKLGEYFRILLEENRKVNLVSRETQPEDLRRLAAESLFPLTVIDRRIGSYLDIGAGGGFPAIPILLSGQVQGEVVLIERTHKKADALGRILGGLDLKAEILPKAFEEIQPPRRFDLITLRYVKLSLPLLKKILSSLAPGGKLVHYSGPLSTRPTCDCHPYTFFSPESSINKQFTVYC